MKIDLIDYRTMKIAIVLGIAILYFGLLPCPPVKLLCWVVA
jgi:hypothetical protein